MNAHLEWGLAQSFLAVARAGRLTVAARILGVDHSTLSRRMTALERSLQVTLFIRQPSGYTLTPAGEAFLASANEMESTALRAIAGIGKSRPEVSGVVRVGAAEGFGNSFLAPRLHLLHARHPDLQVQLVTLPRVFSLSKREADIAIGLAAPATGHLRTRKLTDYLLCIYGAADYLDRHPPIQDEAALRTHPFVGYIADMIYAPELDYLPSVAANMVPSLHCTSILAQAAATASGYGLCVLPCFMADPNQGLRRVMSDKICLRRSFHLMVHSDLVDLPQVRATADFIAEEAELARPLFVPPMTAADALIPAMPP